MTIKVKWKFEKIINEVFNLKIDYSDLMNLKFDNNLKIKEIDHKFNSHDMINLDTVLLHTTNRITQPWKEGLKINFVKNFSNTQIIKEYVKKFINKPYNKELISKNFMKHPNEDVINCVKKLFKDAKSNNYFNQDDIEKEYKDLNISKKIFE